jgi:hypothetical protein
VNANEIPDERDDDVAATDCYAWVRDGKVRTGTLGNYGTECGVTAAAGGEIGGLVQLIVGADLVVAVRAADQLTIYHDAEEPDYYRWVMLEHAGHHGRYRIDNRA